LFGHFDLFVDHGLKFEVDFFEIFEFFLQISFDFLVSFPKAGTLLGNGLKETRIACHVMYKLLDTTVLGAVIEDLSIVRFRQLWFGVGCMGNYCVDGLFAGLQ
jgi:hypothetical protein